MSLGNPVSGLFSQSGCWKKFQNCVTICAFLSWLLSSVKNALPTKCVSFLHGPEVCFCCDTNQNNFADVVHLWISLQLCLDVV